MSETVCAFFDFNTCRAQHCGGYAPALSGPPFCAECRALLPETWWRRVEAEWNAPILKDTPCEVWRTFKGRTSGATLHRPTSEVVVRPIHDMDAEIAKNRRIEVETAWLLRKLRRNQPSPLPSDLGRDE